MSNKIKHSALLVANGQVDSPVLLLETLINIYHFSNDFLIACADGALKNCLLLRLVPDIVIGDMDSISEDDKKTLESYDAGTKFIKSSCEKDESDTQLALEYLVENSIKNIILIGALGKRMDHSLANIFNLSSVKLDKASIKIVDENHEISVLKAPADVHGKTGDTLSIFSLTPSTYFINTEGLKYRLCEEKLFFSPVRGLSNVFENETARLNFKDGVLLLIKEISSNSKTGRRSESNKIDSR